MDLKRLLRYWSLKLFAPGKLVHHKYEAFKELLRYDKRSLELITELEEIRYRGLLVDWACVASLLRALCWSTGCLIRALVSMHPGIYASLEGHFYEVESSLMGIITLPGEDSGPPYILDMAAAASVPQLAGGKAAALGRICRDTDLRVPRGFVVTTNAFQLFLQHNQLRHRLDELLARVRLDDAERLEELGREMQALVKQAEIPPALAEAIAQKLHEPGFHHISGFWAVRSSARGEDGEVTWAGQYASVLNVSRAELFDAYKTVLASKYSPRAVSYRLRTGLADQEVPMAALFLEMVEAAASGVIHTQEQRGPEAATYLAVYAVPESGERLVGGRTVPEVHYLSREENPRLYRRLASPVYPLNTDKKENFCLSEETAVLLAQWGLELEKLAGQPQDIEWVLDNQGRLFVLQSRPLPAASSAIETAKPDKSITIDYPVLLARGVTACPGVGIGRVQVVRREEELRSVPEETVLISPTLPPAFASIIGRLRAVVADGGSPASHFASVAREYGLPVIVGCREATKVLSPGQLVTVDANYCRVYQGEVKSLTARTVKPLTPTPTRFARRLQALMERISPLHLTHPAAADFVPQKCRSLHDFVRFCHEKGMVEMFSLVGRHGRGLRQARRLVTGLPLVMYILDLEDGISPQAAESKTVEPRFIACEPMRAFWKGLAHPDVVWQKGLLHLDWEEFDRVSGGLISLRSGALASFAIISKDYLHLNLRFGYHFAVTDALCTNDPELNYLAFRFKGGGGNFENRLLRVQFIKLILEWAGFAVNTRADLLDARFDRNEASQILTNLTLLGLLQGKTRLLDMSLTNADQVMELAAAFKERYGEYFGLI